MTASAIPETWFHITLGDVARVSSGMGFPQKYQGKQEGIYPVYKVGDISNAVINHKGKAFLAGNYVGELEAKELKGEVFSEGATLFAKIGEAIKLNRRAFVTRAGLADNNVMAVIPEKLISKQFIHYFMRTVDLTDASRSTTVPSIRKGDVECLPLNIPSQAEQEEIADRLDKLLAQVEATQARLARIPDIIKQFRQSVLAAAVSGKLTEDWQDQLNKPEWQITSLGSLLIDATNGLAKRHGSSGLDTTVLRLADFKDCTRVTGNERTICLTEKEINKYSLQENDILVIRVNGSIDLAGKFILYSNNHAIESFCDHLIRLRIDLNKLSAKYLTYVANEGNGRWYLQNNLSTSAGQNTINQSTIKGLKIPLPSINEQTEIVRRVEQLFAYADSIEQQAKTAKARVDNLTQAILAKAFRGELTADWRVANPHLISGDNSAAALLARIQAERATAKPRKRATKTSAT
ncbi:restriction endonuclease subunit S [Aeromonas veronii]|uniref:restriction endonuclease subunit S n=1 Tax=Aeromonas veronii TaxID=654 RepID=UPI00301BC837